MATRSLAEIAAACGGKLRGGPPELLVAGAAIDSRKVVPGNLFVALPGARTDGHAFVADAFARGAAAALVESVPADAAGGALVVVDDPLAALHALTRAVRRTLPRRGLVAVTGSAGKTTTKELTGRLLAGLAKTATSPGNLNNLLGFPLALLGADDDAVWLVAELGMSTPGELGAVAALARPDVAVYTCIRPVHLASFGTLEAIAEAKAELLGGLATGGLIVANADDPQVMRIVRRHLATADPTARLHTYAIDAPAATVRAVGIHPLAGGRGSRFRLELAGGAAATVELPLLGRHNVENALAAATVALALGATSADVAAGLAQARPAPMRGVVHGLPGDVVLIDDSYNSNPAALERALEAAAAIPAARRWAVLGDMLELGEQEAAFHRRAGERAAALGFDPVLAVGGLAAELAAGVVLGGSRARTLPDAASAAASAAAELRPGDLVLVKGSRGVGLERVVSALLDAARATADAPAAAGGRS